MRIDLKQFLVDCTVQQ